MTYHTPCDRNFTLMSQRNWKITSKEMLSREKDAGVNVSSRIVRRMFREYTYMAYTHVQKLKLTVVIRKKETRLGK